MSQNNSRREFVLKVGGTALALPFLPSLVPNAHAQLSKPPLRFIFIQMRDGSFMSEFWPKMNPAQQLAQGVYGVKLADVPGSISNIMGSDFDIFKNKVTVLRGVDQLEYTFHKTAVAFSTSGVAANGGEESPPEFGSTIDTLIQYSPNFPKSTRIQPLRIHTGGRAFSFYRQGGGTTSVNQIPYITGDQNVFNYAFGNVTSSPTPTPVVSNEKLIMDKVLERYNLLLNNRRLASEDKLRLKHHAEHIQSLQTRLQTPPPPMTATCTKPTLAGLNGNNLSQFNNYMDTIAAAFACDLTRMACLHLHGYSDNGGLNSPHHDNSHRLQTDTVGQQNCRTWQGWNFQRIARLMTKLQEYKEFDGSSVLDNTIIVFANEDGSTGEHTSNQIPFVLMGGAQGKLRMGYYLDYRQRSSAGISDNGIPIHGALIAIMKAAGLTDTEFLNQGNGGGFGTARYHFPDKYTNPNFYRSNPLPYLYTG